jgi:hypothetical protein
MAVKTENTMAEGLQSLVTDIATLKFTADADMEFLIQLETMILGYMKGPMMQQQQQGGMGQMGQGPPGGMGGGQMQMPASPLATRGLMNAPGGAGPSAPMAPPVDEISRMLSR